MITEKDFDDKDAYYFKDGSIWKMEACWRSPTCIMKNIETGVEEHFGLNGDMAVHYEKIKLPDNSQDFEGLNTESNGGLNNAT